MITGANYTSGVPPTSNCTSGVPPTSNCTSGVPPTSTCTESSGPLALSPALPLESGYVDSAHACGTGPPLCAGCSQPILDQFVIQVQGQTWHSSCLRCCVCSVPLSHMCYSGDSSELYCQDDFFRLFGAQCSTCKDIIPPTGIVRRTQYNVYHLECFRCAVCQRELCTGDEIYLCENGELFCKTDYLSIRVKDQGQDESSSVDASKYSKEKLLELYYKQNSKPRRGAIGKIALEAGTSLSEVQWWFRQRRAKDRFKGDNRKNTLEGQCEMTTRVHAPAGGYPLPIVNKVGPPGQLPEEVNQQNFTPTEIPAQMLGNHAQWSAWDELLSNDFVPPNVDLRPEHINNGEVIGLPPNVDLRPEHINNGEVLGLPPNVDLQPEHINDGEVIGFQYQDSLTDLPPHQLEDNLYI